MIQFYYNLGPNPYKVALCLEEMGLPYKLIPVDMRTGDQHAPSFRAINPNGKLPAIVDGGVTVFDSNAILLYLAEKTGRFLPPNDAAARGEFLSWLMFVATGVGPYSGQAVHFKHFAPPPQDYGLTRYGFEAERHWGILDARLAERRFILGEVYTVVDMAAWGWGRVAPFVLGKDAFNQLPHLKRFLDDITARPAAQRALEIKDKHDFKAEVDEAARLAMFPFLKKLRD